ncbi:hypothetical protein [Nonomuraea endophytica]|uniref:hypothetical protein n=1 Tax=Nonomuraea endophytica TaxID=714136 RepID=UPI0037C69493
MDTKLHWHCYLSARRDAPGLESHEWLLQPPARIRETFYDHYSVRRWMLDKYDRHASIGSVGRPADAKDERRLQALDALKIGDDVVWVEFRLGLPVVVIAAICCPNRVDHLCPLAVQDEAQPA